MRAPVVLAACVLACSLTARADEATGARAAGELATATFAGGCFWCMQPPFDAVAGVVSTTAGYTGGSTKNPSYEEVSSGSTGHAEAVEVRHDPAKVTYRQLLEIFWRNVDPTDAGGQFCDRGDQYRSAIFYHDEEQRRLAEQSKQELEQSQRLPGPIVTEIVAATQFYRAEDYHQSYYQKNPWRYRVYRLGCGRDRRLEEVWGAVPAH
jgi:peptide-methionine (S)-S-oxide reductase